MNCARCGKGHSLKPEIYEGVEIDRCPKCGGVWLDDQEIAKIILIKEQEFPLAIVEETLKGAFAGVTESEKETTEHCPKCNELMHPVNYSYSSGIIIDRCQKGHGIWLDKLELEKVQSHAEHWQKEQESRKGEWKALCEATKTQHLAERLEWEKKNEISTVSKVLTDIAEWLGH